MATLVRVHWPLSILLHSQPALVIALTGFPASLHWGRAILLQFLG